MTPEQIATQKVRLAASSSGMMLLRNNAGGFYDDTGRFINFGLGNDGSNASKMVKFGDYIGSYELTITPEMVGKTVAVFTNIEVKPDGHLLKTLRKATNNPQSREGCQLKAINLVNAKGGIGGFATNEIDVYNIINKYLEGLKK